MAKHSSASLYESHIRTSAFASASQVPLRAALQAALHQKSITHIALECAVWGACGPPARDSQGLRSKSKIRDHALAVP